MNTTLNIIRRKKALILGLTLLGFSSTALILKNIKPLYTSTSQIIFNEKSSTFIKTQEELIKSYKVIQSVIIDLELANEPEFNTENSQKNSAHKFKKINPYKTKLKGLSDKIIYNELDPLITHIRENISTQYIKDSYILNISYTNYSPKNAAIILNKLLDNYIKNIEVNNTKSLNNKNIYQLEKRVNAAKYELEKYKQKIMLQEKYSFLDKPNKEYEDARTKYENAVEKFYQFINDNGEVFPNPQASEVLKSPIILNLKLKYNNINQQINALSNYYGARHPKIIELKAKTEIINKQINHEINNIVNQVKSEYNYAKNRLENIENNKKLLQDKEIEQSELQILQDNFYNAQTLYNDYKNIYENTKNANPAPAQILSRATLATAPSSSSKPKILIASGLISFIISVLISILIEKNRNTFLSARQLEEYLNLPCFALVPKANKDKDKSLASYIIENPSSPTAEAVRSLRLVLKLHADAKNLSCKVVTITSSFQNEGKTTLSSWIAQIAAKSGKRVILIDADLRAPSIHKCFNKENKLSLVEYLSGKNRLDEIVDTSNPFGLHVIYGRSVPNSALDLISSEKMDQLIRSLRKTYDMVIIDSPACMAVPDARALERYSDQIIYAVLWNKTHRQVVHNGISQFLKFGKPPIATVLTNIDLKKHIQFGYGNSINYYERYKEYSTT